MHVVVAPMFDQFTLGVDVFAAQEAAKCLATKRFSAPLEAFTFDALAGNVGIAFATTEPLPLVAEFGLPSQHCV